MKKILLFLVLFSTFLSSFSFAKADPILDIFRDNSDVIYCQDDECSLNKWTQIVKNDLKDIEKDRKASEYIQDVIKYLLSFVSIVAVIYIIYAWFNLLTSAWGEEWTKKSKTTIVSVLIWIVIMWLAYGIVAWLIKVVTISQ